MDKSEIYSKRLNVKEVIFPKEKGEFIFPIADGRIKTLGGDTLVRHRPIQGEINIDFLGESERSPLSPCLVHVRKLQKPPSRRTQSQTLLAEARIIPYSTEIH